MNETAAKAIWITVLSALTLWIQILAVPVVLLVAAMVLDYATGLMASNSRNEKITSYKSVNGIAKKVCCLLLVVVALLLDCLVLYGREAFGLAFPWSFVISAVIAVWLTVNEIISILENIQDITGRLPGWLLPLVNKILSQVENIPPKSEQMKDEGEGDGFDEDCGGD